MSSFSSLHSLFSSNAFRTAHRESVGEAATLAEFLKVNTSLTNLELQYNDIGPEGAKQIAKALQGEMVGRGKLHEGDVEAAGKVVKAKEEPPSLMKVNNSIRSIELGANDIGVEGAKAIGLPLQRRLISRLESNQLNKARNIFDFSEPADPSDPSVQQLLSAKFLCRPADAPPLPSPFRPVYDLNIKHLNAAIRTLLHDNVVDIYGWSPRLLSYLLNDPHCQPCLFLFAKHIANGNLPASSLPAFRVRKGTGLWYGAPRRRKIRPISWGPAIYLLAHTAVCLLIAKTDDEAAAEACPKSLDLSLTQFALGADGGNQAAAARALIASSEWDQNVSLVFILWHSRSDPPSHLVEFAAEHNKSIDIGFCKLLGGIISNYNDEHMADAVVTKAFSRIDAVFDALSSLMSLIRFLTISFLPPYRPI
eukprot:g8585.t1